MKSAYIFFFLFPHQEKWQQRRWTSNKKNSTLPFNIYLRLQNNSTCARPRPRIKLYPSQIIVPQNPDFCLGITFCPPTQDFIEVGYKIASYDIFDVQWHMAIVFVTSVTYITSITWHVSNCDTMWHHGTKNTKCSKNTKVWQLGIELDIVTVTIMAH
jgi:hypothetical protein